MSAESVGVVAAASYLPWFRLTAAEIARSQRSAAPRRAAERRLAGFDEDALTMAVGAARLLPLGAIEGLEKIVFTSTTPPYLVKNNASAAHAALGLDDSVGAFDLGGALRSAVGALFTGGRRTLLLCGDVTTARPGAAAELGHGDAAAALVLGDAGDAIAEIVTSVSHTDELLDQWRIDGQPWASYSEDRFPVSRYGPVLESVLARLPEPEFEHVVVSAPSARVAALAAKRAAGLGKVHARPGIGFAGAADVAVQLCAVLAVAAPGDRILVLSVADGCDAIVLRCTDLLESRRPLIANDGEDVGQVPTYLDALAWRGLLQREPPRRPEPSPVSPSVSGRRIGWKFGLHGSACPACGAVATPPQRVCVRCGSAAQETVDLSRRAATVRTFSVDRLAFSPNPPMIAAVIDFDGGGRFEVEMTDTPPESLAVGQRVQMTFRLRHSSGGIHNYAWKAIAEETTNG
jgi:hydroxymethylglutaryl-CoA synthase